LLQDLTFVETNPNRVEVIKFYLDFVVCYRSLGQGGLVSWSKRTKIYECVDSVMRFQVRAFCFPCLFDTSKSEHQVQPNASTANSAVHSDTTSLF
jgi:hypothetical protein